MSAMALYERIRAGRELDVLLAGAAETADAQAERGAA